MSAEGRRITDPGAALWRWLSLAPPAVVLFICLGLTGGLAGWVWALSADLGAQKAVTAVAATQAAVASGGQQEVVAQINRVESAVNARVAQQEAVSEARLARIENKLDRLIEQMAADRRRENKP